MQEEQNEPVRAITFTISDYEAFEQKLKKGGRSRYLFIQGRKVIDVDHRCVDSRDERLRVGRYSLKNLPHYEGLLNAINKKALDYEREVSQVGS